jgi:hypothetical protein
MKKAYLSGKISGLPYKNVRKKFNKSELILNKLGFKVVNPVKLKFPKPESQWIDYMEVCIDALWDCQYIILMPCWKNSPGAMIEHAIAKNLGLHVLYMTKNFAT